METIVHAAIEEICAQGINGISLSLLWPRLHSSLSSAGLNLCSAVKRAVWSGLIGVPGLQFRASNGSEFDPKSKSFEECESLNLTVFANEQLRRCFVGLYDVKASNITPPQQRVLERLALARENGVTQNQLCKELGMAANNFFYVVKRLECWGLIARQSTIVRTKESSIDKEPKNSQPVHTNLIRLHRYALPLSSQQRLEITKENKLEENLGENISGADPLGECGQDDVRVDDFLPAIKAVCDRLEQAEGKVLVVSDIKQELGYRETRGHRAWRNICNRLKQAGLVELFEAKVDSKVDTPTKSKKSKSRGRNKPVSCLRLLKKFSPKNLQQKNPDCEYNDLVSEQTTTSGNRVQNTDQLVELSLEQQIFDMIDREGSKGILGVDVCRRLGISTKMFDNLTNTMVSRFGLHQLSENRKRGSAYRFWTPGNFCPELPNSSLSSLQDGSDGHQMALAPVQMPSCGADSQRNFADTDSLNSQKWRTGEIAENKDADEEPQSQQGRGSVQMIACPSGSPDLAHDMSLIVPRSVDGIECSSTTKASANPLTKQFNLQEGRRYPSLTSAQREIRILERLETEKIIIKPELQRWLESFEKDKQSRMDRRTLTHILKKLEQKGKCKLMVFSVPGVSNCGQLREIHVVLHPSVKGTASELSEVVHDRSRSFEMLVRGALSPLKTEVPVPVLHGIERIQINATSDTQSAKSEVMRANGFVLAKMVRTKLLHRFLWNYVNDSAKCTEVSLSTNDPHSSCLLFGLHTAIKAMPFELFLQVVGSPLEWADMIEKCKTGLLLSEFSDEEYKSLMDTRATGRLSWLIDILRRLKLIRLVADESLEEATKISHAKLIYALELKPYIEEPPSMDPLHRGFGSLEFSPHFRHDFVLSTSDAVDKYWQTLEYCYAAADPIAAEHAFPGSAVLEVCLYRSWTTVRVMKAEQRAELLKRIKDQHSKKLSFQECREIAKDLNLTLEQVLRVYYDNRQQRLNRFQGDLNVQGVVSDARSDKHPQSHRKRKKLTEGRSAKHAKVNHTSDSHEDSEQYEELEVDQQQQQELSIDHNMMPMLKQPRQQKFSWTEEADRHLLIQYARRRAMQGARRGTDWAAISDLPAPPTTCRRRVSALKRDMKFRKSLMRLCNLLAQRYAQHLDHEKNLMVRDEYNQESDSQEQRWDDFDDSKIKIALHEVLMHKQMIKSDSAKRSEFTSQGTHNLVASRHYKFENDSEKQQMGSSRRSRRHRLPQKFVKHLKEGVNITRRMNQSLAVSCAVELFKLVFLTNSKTAETPNLLAETLCCYSEHDLFSAFDYLRQKKNPGMAFLLYSLLCTAFCCIPDFHCVLS
ncbi:General transcription factor 3C polypeptide 1 [Bienertia sinuspersici]